MDNAKRYSVTVQWSDEDAAFVATALEFEHLSGIGPTQASALEALNWAIEAACEVLLVDGLPLPNVVSRTTYSGNLRVRVPKSIHRQVAERAQFEGVSLNHLASTYLSQGLMGGSRRIAVDVPESLDTPDLKCIRGGKA